MQEEIDLNIANITSRYVLKELSVIVRVFHNSDGMWEFYGNDFLKDDDFKIISLDEILKIDKSIYSILSLPEGYYAIRANNESRWNISRIIEEGNIE